MPSSDKETGDEIESSRSMDSNNEPVDDDADQDHEENKSSKGEQKEELQDRPKQQQDEGRAKKSKKRRFRGDNVGGGVNKTNAKLFQDCISVEIPLDFTADLRVAWRHTRKKRISALLESFPSLVQTSGGDNTDAAGASDSLEDSGKEDSGENVGDDPAGGSDKGEMSVDTEKGPTNAPNRKSYSNMLDYLEAKYAKGVMVDDGQQATGDGYEDDEKGSVYSETSWIDDSDLKRDVAEQVMAHTTTTKMELTTDDSEFFVNVGTLEVEETEQTKDHYDPLKDMDDDEKKKVRVRKKPKPKLDLKKTSSGNTTKSSSKANKTVGEEGGGGNKPKGAPAVAKKDTAVPPPPKKKAKKMETEKPQPEQTPSQPPPSPASKERSTEPEEPSQAEQKESARMEAEKKAAMEKAYVALVAMIKGMSDEELPRRKTKDRVALTCPADKKPGDSILFENPHVKGQRLKVKIPKNTQPGGIFKVTVPVPKDTSDNDDDGETDHNRWSRELYESLSDYAYHYDVWVDAVAERHVAMNNKDFSGHFEKRKKFDQLVYEFPKDLKTPVDKAYMQKILRRARQNKHKRDKTAKRLEERAKELSSTTSSTPLKEPENDEQDTMSVGKSPRPKGGEAPSVRRTDSSTTRLLVKLPVFAKVFEEKAFVADDFL